LSIWNLTISVISLVLAAFGLRQEFRRPSRHWLWARCFASLLSVLGLWGMGFYWKISVKREEILEKRDRSSYGDSAEKNTGFLDIHWTRLLNSGQPFIIQGRFRNLNDSGIELRIEAFGATLDSVYCPSGKDQSFTMQAIPKQTGKAIFQMNVIEGKNLLETEPVPVLVQPQAMLNVMILSSYPDFENKFLGQWLTGAHISVVNRTRISRDRFEKTFINRKPLAFDRITDTLLKPFDLLICDVASFAALSRTEQISIRRQVAENGLGLMMRIDTMQNKKMFYDASFPFYYFSLKTNDRRYLLINDSSKSIAYSGQKEGLGIRFQDGTQPLVRENGGQIRVSSQQYGKGKMVSNTLGNTFEWSLDGREQDYGWYWTFLIQKTAKQKPESFQVSFEEPFPVKDRPVHITLESGNNNPPEPKVGTASFYLRQQKNLLTSWNGTFWPEQSGWQPALHAGDRYFDWYVFDRRDWKRFTAQTITNPVEKKIDNRNRRVLLFFIIYMSGWCFLWLERKLSLI
jgi:hypothetical protein